MDIYNKSNTEKAIKGISVQSIVSISVGVVEIVSFSIMSRLLTKEGFGYYAVVMAIVMIFQSFSETGIGSAIIQRKDIDKHFINNAFTLCLIIGLFLMSLLLVLSNFLAQMVADDSLGYPLRLMSITLLLYCLSSVNLSIMNRRLQFLRVGIIQLSASIVSIIAAITMALAGYGYYSILAKTIVSATIIWLFSLYLAKTRYSLAFNKNVVVSIVNYSGWLMASVVFRNISQQIDRLMMPKLLSIEALGAYNRPKDLLLQISSRLNGIFDTALFPVLSSIQDDVVKLRNAFNKSLYLLNIFSTLLCMLFIYNSDLIIKIFLGNEWVELKYLVWLFSIAVLFNADGRLADCYMRSIALTKQQFYFRVTEAILKVIMSILGASWGIYGVAAGFVISDVLVKFVKLVYIGRKLNLNTIEICGVIINSWRFLIVFLPICTVSYILLPNTLMGNICMLLLFGMITVFIFVFFPLIVGVQYKDGIYADFKKKLFKSYV